jgi:transcription termination/antitermination protein NusG
MEGFKSDIDYSQTDRRWYAVYTVVRHEKAVNNALKEKQIETFLPIREVISQWKDRKKRVLLPLFPGYLFVNTTLDDKLNILNTRGIVRILGISGTPAAIPHEQIESIRKLLESKVLFDPHPYLREGKKVIVTHGPLQGIVGRIVKRKGLNKLILSVDLIKRAVSVEVDIEIVELVES